MRASQHLPHRRASSARAPTSRWSSRSRTTSSRAPPGQAIQNMNLMFGLPETTGLDRAARSCRRRRRDGARLPSRAEPAVLDQRAADGGANAPGLAVAGRRSRSRSSPRSPACGGGASISARSSAASTAARERAADRDAGRRHGDGAARGVPSCAARNTQLESELAMMRGAAGDAAEAAGRGAAGERAAQGRARVLPAVLRRRDARRPGVGDPAHRARAATAATSCATAC